MKAIQIYIVIHHSRYNDEGCSHGYRCDTWVYQTYQEAKDAFQEIEKDNITVYMDDPQLETYGVPQSLYEITLVPTNHHTFFHQIQDLIHSACAGNPPDPTNSVLLERNWKYVQHSQWRLKAITTPRTNAPHDPQPVSQGELS